MGIDNAGADLERIFYGQGYVVVENMLSQEKIDSLQYASNNLLENQDEPGAPIASPHEQDIEFLSLMKYPTIVKALERLVDSRVSCVQTLLYFKPSGAGGRDAHQENFYHQSEPGGTITVWTPLDASSEANGGLYVYPGSHKEPILPVVADESRINQETNRNGFKKDRGISCVIPDKYRKQHLLAFPGDVVFMHNHLIHGSDTNYSEGKRRAHSAAYCRKGIAFNNGKTSPRKEIDVYGHGLSV